MRNSTLKVDVRIKANGQVVCNVDIIQTIDKLVGERKVVLRHVRAHTGNDTWEAKYNDIVDIEAKMAAINKKSTT